MIFMNTRNFKCFQTVYEERNLQTAAGKLFLSPQGLSKIIKSMEDECGAALFVRTKEGFVPTESGKIFYEKSKQITKEINDMFSHIESINDKEKRFKIGFAAGTIRAIDISKVNSFMNSNSQVYASWHEHENESVINQVLNDEISFGLVIGKPIASNNLEIALVKSIELVIYVYKDHKFWNRDSIEIKDLRDEHIISMNENYHIYHDLINACYLNDFTPDIVGKVGEGESIYLLVANQVGVGIAPRFFSDNDRIKAIRIKDSYTWDVYGIYRNDSADKDLAKEFLDII